MEFLILLESGREIYFTSVSSYPSSAREEAENFASRYDINRGYSYKIINLEE